MGRLGRILGRLGGLLGCLGAVLEVSWAVLGRPLGTIEAIMAASWDAPGDIQAVQAEFWHQKDAKGGAAPMRRSGMREAPFAN